MLYLATLSIFTNATEFGRVYIVNLKYEGDKFSLVSDVYVKSGYPPGRKIQPAGYECEVISFEDKEPYSFKFDLPTKWFYDHINPKTGDLSGGVIELEDVNFTLIIPYFSNGKKINIYNQTGVLIISIDISNFSIERCRNGICDKNEDYQTCPQDCEKRGDLESQSFLLLTILGILLFVIFLTFSKVQRKNK